MNNQVHSALSGTETEQNLHTAFTDKSVSHMKYMLYADKARENGNIGLALLLESIANNDYRHAELISEYLGLYGHDTDNLESLMALEEFDATVTYPEYEKIASNEGFSEISDKMRAIASADAHHHSLIENAHKMMTEKDNDGEDAPLYCPVCGYVTENGETPERCPLCSRPARNFRPYN